MSTMNCERSRPSKRTFWSLRARLPSAICTRSMESSYPAEAGFETLAGFLFFQIGEIPKVGDVIEVPGRRFTIIEMDRNRIACVKIEKLQ